MMAGCTLGAPATPDRPEATDATHEEQVPLQRGEVHEIDFTMRADDAVRILLNASRSVRWDVHSHVGDELRTWDEGEGRVADVALRAPEEGTYSVLVRATEAGTTVLRVNITGAFELEA